MESVRRTATTALSADTVLENSPQNNARIAGLFYLAMVVLGVFGLLYVPGQIIVPDDPALTVSHIIESESLLRMGIVSALLTQVVFIFLALALYRVLYIVDRKQALLMVILAIVGIPIAMINEINPIAALLIAKNPRIVGADQMQDSVMFFLDLQKTGINIASIFWGLWLLPFGYLIIRSDFLPKILGVFLIVDGTAYVIDFFTAFLAPNFDFTFTDFAIGELLIMLWLVLRGLNAEKWKQQAQKIA